MTINLDKEPTDPYDDTYFDDIDFLPNNKDKYIDYTDDVRANLRILIYKEEGTGLLYDGDIFRKIPLNTAYSYLAKAYQKETDNTKIPNKEKLKLHFAELFIGETDKNMSEILIGRDGEGYDLGELKSLKNQINRYSKIKSNEIPIRKMLIKEIEELKKNTEWIKERECYKYTIPTQKLGAKYILPQDRLRESKIVQFLKERIVDEENFNVYMTAIAKGLLLKVVTKNVFVIVNPMKNTGKTTQAKILLKMYGDYATQLPSIKYISSDSKEEEAMKFFYRNKNKRFILFGETNRDTILDEVIIKKLTGRDDLPVPYISSIEDTFNVNFQLFGGGSNEPFELQSLKSALDDRLFYFPFGKIIPLNKRIGNYEDILGNQEEVDLFFSYLIDNYYPQAITVPIQKTQMMKYTDDYAQLIHKPIQLFLDRCCLQGISSLYSKIQTYTCTEVYDLFTNFIRLYGVYLITRLHFNYDDTGKELSITTMLGIFNVPSYSVFKKYIDSQIGSAKMENRTNRGYRWTNLFIKAPSIYFYNENTIRQFNDTFDSFLSELDNIQTMDEAVTALQRYTSQQCIAFMMNIKLLDYFFR